MSRLAAVSIALLVILGAVSALTAVALLPVAAAHAVRTDDARSYRPMVTPSPTAGCVVGHTKRAAPLTVTLGSTVDVTLTARVTCTVEPVWLHVVLVLDESGAMAGAPEHDMKQAAIDLVIHLDLPHSPGTYVGVVGFSDRALRASPLSQDQMRVREAIAVLSPSGGSEIDRGLAEADRVLQQGRQWRAPDVPTEVVVLFSRGHDDNGCESAVAAARTLKGKGVVVVTVCVGDDCDERCMREIASSPRYYFRVDNIAGLLATFDLIRDPLRNIAVKRMVVTDTLGADVDYVSGSASPAPRMSAPDGRLHVWEDVYVPRSGLTYSLKVRPLRAGRLPTNLRADGWLLDNKNRPIAWTFDVPFVTVIEPTPVPSVAPVPTPTQTPTTMPSASAPPSATPTATATVTSPPLRWTVHLPRAVR